MIGMGSQRPVEIEGIELRGRIGSGGFGEVWLGHQTALDRPVAIKVGHRTLAGDQDRRRFERECKALGRLSGHPNIVDVHTSGVVDGRPYLVLQYVPGGTLADHGIGLGESRLRAVADQLCEAVAAAHEIGVLHRDLKPENVFLDSGGIAILGDFGIARIGDGDNTATGAITASVAFAAPEILNGDPPSEVADVYGIGVTMVSAILGRSPFVSADHTSPEAVIARVLKSEPPPLSDRGISPEFDAVLRRAMDRDPNRRPRSARALQSEIRALPAVAAELDTITIHGPPATNPATDPAPVPIPGAAPDRSTTGRTVLATFGFGLLAVAAVVGTLLVFRDDGATLESSPAATVESTVTSQPQQATNAEPEPAAPPPTTTTTVTTADSGTTPPNAVPLALPLSGADISNLTPIPIDFDDLDDLVGPADAPSFCDARPDITGLVETIAAVYPADPRTDASLRQVVQRMHRFSTVEQAERFVDSFATIDCDEWESTDFTSEGITVLRANEVVPTVSVGDEIRQVDQVATFPAGFDILSRSVVVRSGTDVLKLVLFTIREEELTELTDKLVGQAGRSLGY